MSDSGNQRSISEDLKLALIDSALWERLKGPHRKFVFTRECARQCWTGHLKHRTALIQLLSRWFLRHFLRSDSLLYSPTAVRLESGCFKQTLWLDSNQTTRNCDHQASRPFLYPILKCSITKSHIFVCKRTLSSCIHKQNVYLLWFYFDKKCLVWLS